MWLGPLNSFIASLRIAGTRMLLKADVIFESSVRGPHRLSPERTTF